MNPDGTVAAPGRARHGAALLSMALGVLALSAGLRMAAPVADIPAGLRDLPSHDASTGSIVFFCVALLWLGGAPAWVADQLLRRPWSAAGLPVWSVGLGVIGWWLLRLSMAGFAGGGEVWDWQDIGRVAGVYGSLALTLILGSAVVGAFYTTSWRTASNCAMFLLLIGAPWLTLALLAFVSCDAADGRAWPVRISPWPGPALLMGLALVVGMSASALAHGLRLPSVRRLLSATLLCGLGLPAGWLLASLALAPGATGPDGARPAFQGLLGPEGAAPASPSELFLRWGLVQAGAVAALAWAQWSVLLLSEYAREADGALGTPAARAGRPALLRSGEPARSPGRAYLLLAMAYAAFVLYGSLVPLDFRPAPLTDAWSEFWQRWPWPESVSRSDFAANVLLGVPLGFLGMGFLTRENTRRARWAAALLLVAAAALFSSLVEFSQLYVPERTTSFSDILAQSAGAAIGITLWFVAGAPITCYVRGLWAEYIQDEQAMRVLGGYAVLFLVYQLLPFDLTIRPAEIYHKLRDGHVNLVPFAGPGDLAPYALLSRIAVLIPIGYALVLLCRGRRHALPAAVVGGALYAAGIELAQLFVLSRYSSATDVALGSLGAAVGGWLALHFGPAARRGLTETPFWARHGWQIKALLVLGLAGGLLWSRWHGLGLEWPSEGLGPHIRESVCVPLATYYYQSEVNASAEVAREFLVFVFLGLLVRSLAADFAGRLWAAIALALLAVMGIAVLLEAGLLFIPHRQVDPASAVVEMAGGLVGVMLYRRFVATFVTGPEGAGQGADLWSTT